MRFTPRQHLPHAVPEWVPAGSLFFITIHGAERIQEPLTLPSVATRLLSSVQHYEQLERWFVRVFLLMPDHVHALVAFPGHQFMRGVVTDWKRFTAREAGAKWQRDFFDHRVRGREHWQQYSDYIRSNPVRKGLVARIEDWPWIYPGVSGRVSEPT